MVYQEPGRALNPSIRAGRQIAEVFEIAGLDRTEARDRAEDMLRQVQIPDPGQVMDRYPHQLSGGMAQRVVIAMALAAEPALLILDEPTTALDATVEAEVLDLVAGLRAQMATSVLFISHNLAVINKMCDRVGVLYAGELVEEGPANVVFDQPSHPYTVGLLRCIPRRGQRKDHGRLDAIPGFLPAPGQQITGCIFAERCALVVDECRTSPPPPFEVGFDHTARCYRHEEAAELPRSTPADASLPAGPEADDPIVTVRGLSTTYRNARTELKALTGIDLQIMRGETLGLVGESGSGKTTLARALLGLVQPDPGSVLEFDGAPLPADLRRRPLELLRAVQIVFQNPDSALNRRHTVQPATLQARRAVRQSPGRTPRRPGQVGPDGTAPPEPATRPAFRRLEAAGRDRSGIRRRTQARRLRRADFGARCLRPGSDPQPARRPAGQGAGDVPVHLP
jgi:peptide/nickel transport system ATP-binding protein